MSDSNRETEQFAAKHKITKVVHRVEVDKENNILAFDCGPKIAYRDKKYWLYLWIPFLNTETLDITCKNCLHHAR